LEERVLTGSEVSATATGVQIGYAPSEESWRIVNIPMLFCDSCVKHFNNDWRKARLKVAALRIAKMFWIFPAAIVFVVFLAILPLVSLSLAVFILYATYRNLSRRRADGFLTGQLCKSPLIAKLFEEDEYELSWESYQRLPIHGSDIRN
jgi:hypothetical protein